MGLGKIIARSRPWKQSLYTNFHHVTTKSKILKNLASKKFFLKQCFTKKNFKNVAKQFLFKFLKNTFFENCCYKNKIFENCSYNRKNLKNVAVNVNACKFSYKNKIF